MNFTHKNNWKEFAMKEFEKNQRFKELQAKMFRKEKMSIEEWTEMLELGLKGEDND